MAPGVGTHARRAWLTRPRLAYSVGFSLPGDVASIQAKLATIPADLWEPASDADGQLRPGAWVADRVIKADPTAGAALPRRRKAAAAMTIPTAGEVGAALDL